MNKLVFEVIQDADGGYTAEGLGQAIFTQGDTWEQLRANVLEAAQAFFFDRPAPSAIRLRCGFEEIPSIA